MADSILRDKSRQFAVQIVYLCRKLRKSGIEFALTSQLMRSGTSIGANIHEAQYAQGKKDFISKLEIALKECNESDYWLELLNSIGNLSVQDYKYFKSSIIELRRMLVASVLTVKKSLS